MAYTKLNEHSPKGTYFITASFSSVKSGSYYHAIWPLPLGNSYTSVTLNSITSQVGSVTSALTKADVTTRLLSDNAIDFYMNVDAAAGKAFTMSITLA